MRRKLPKLPTEVSCCLPGLLTPLKSALLTTRTLQDLKLAQCGLTQYTHQDGSSRARPIVARIMKKEELDGSTEP